MNGKMANLVEANYTRMKWILLIFLGVAFWYTVAITITRAVAGDSISIDTYTVLDLISALLVLLCFLPMLYLWAIEDLYVVD